MTTGGRGLLYASCSDSSVGVAMVNCQKTSKKYGVISGDVSRRTLLLCFVSGSFLGVDVSLKKTFGRVFKYATEREMPTVLSTTATLF